jgi:Flp pilus assembly pilin Flp
VIVARQKMNSRGKRDADPASPVPASKISSGWARAKSGSCRSASSQGEIEMHKQFSAPVLAQFHNDTVGQDLIEYVIIVAFGIMLIAALTALYNTAKGILERANSELQSIPGN